MDIADQQSKHRVPSVLDGAPQFTVNDEQVVVGPGQAAYFGLNEQHALRVADGASSTSFLEFHIPADYSTVRAANVEVHHA